MYVHCCVELCEHFLSQGAGLVLSLEASTSGNAKNNFKKYVCTCIGIYVCMCVGMYVHKCVCTYV